MFGINYSTDSNYQEILKLDRMLTDAIRLENNQN